MKINLQKVLQTKFVNQSLVVVTTFVLSSLTLQLSADQNWSYTYNSLGLVETEDGPRTDVNDVNSYSYDAAGNKISMTNALGQVTQYLDYDARGKVGRIIDVNGVETVLTYHPRGWLSSSTVKHASDSNLDATTSYQYNAVTGLMTQMTLPNGAILNYQYDAARRLIAISNHLNERIDYTLDAEGNKVQEVVSKNSDITQVVTRSFDELSRLMQVLGNNGQVNNNFYDTNDNTIQTLDGNLNNTEQSFDALNRVETITQADDGEIQFVYDAHDRIVSVSDPRGVTTTYSYDAFDNVISEQSPDRGTITYTYDAANNRTSQHDARGITTSYNYDALNRLTSVVFNDDPMHLENISYTYDDQSNGNNGAGRLTGFVDASGATQLHYNHLGLLIEKNVTLQNQPFQQQWHFDKAGNLIEERYPSGMIVSYQLDTLGRVAAVHIQTESSATPLVLANNMLYQPFGALQSVTLGNGIYVDYQFDLDGRVSGISATGAAPLQEKIYAYDNANNIIGIDDNVDASFDQMFAVDMLNRLIQGIGNYGNKEYEYDASSNRTALLWPEAGDQFYSYENHSNRLLQAGTTDYQYDAAGNAIAIGETQYHYNANNRLTEVSRNGEILAHYQHNALGQRVSKYVPGAVAADAPGQGTDNSVNDGDKLRGLEQALSRAKATLEQALFQQETNPGKGNKTLTEDSQLLFVYNQSGQLQGEYNADGSAVREYIYLNGTPLALIEHSNNQIGYYHSDHLGTPQRVTGDHQQILWQASYTPFGRAQLLVENITQPLRFPGQYFDSETGLHYNYFRDYDPTTGRYLQSDPIGLDGGLNTFGYVNGNSLISSDPLGLCGTSQSLSWSLHGGFSCNPRPPTGCPNGDFNCSAGLPPDPSKEEQKCIQKCEQQWVEVCINSPAGRKGLVSPVTLVAGSACYLAAKLHCASKKCEDCEQ